MRRNKNNGLFKKIITAFVVIVALILFRKPILFLFEKTKSATVAINNKFVNFKSKIYDDAKFFKDRAIIVSNVDEYISDVRKKEIEYQEMALKLKDYEEIKKDNYELKELLNLKKYTGITTIAAKVKLVEQSNNDTIYIDKGSIDEIKKGQVVLYNGKMIGLIEDVLKDYAKVRLLVSKESKISVLINDSDLGVLRGNGNNSFSIKNYNKDMADEVKYYKITTSGISNFIPKKIDIGVFEVANTRILKEDKELIFEPEYNYLDINYVLVVKELKNE